MARLWTKAELQWLTETYPERGKDYCAKMLERSEGSIRSKTSEIGLKQNGDGAFFKDWQGRAATAKIGKKRPDQADVMRRNHKDGKMIKTAKQRKAMGERSKKWIAENGHPRGYEGHKHGAETLEKISKASKRTADKRTPEERSDIALKGLKTKAKNGTLVIPRRKTTWKQGWREIGGIKKYYRSRWEANYARYLEWLLINKQIAKWEHEPETFWFEGIMRGCRSYLPDFKVTENNGSIVYHEVKGWMDARSKTKIKRMAKYHPDVKLIVIDSKAYKALTKQIGGALDGWE